MTSGPQLEHPVALRIEPATADRFEDVATLLGPRRPDAAACWCLAYWTTSAENTALTGAQRPDRLRELCAGPVPPGLLAYRDGEPVGWCAVGPREEMGRLRRSRTIPVVDELPVWSVVCFVVAPGHRRTGVARALLAGAVDHAAVHGAPAVEGYPVDPAGGRISGSLAYVGTTAMFEATGFSRAVATSARSAGFTRWLVRRDLTGQPVGSSSP
ncbi:GNAT family N-acetyltransferase [Modestobacter roseus]|uniref:GNAT family N-acetyltransferase n=1 Tax=Modestobacter roseus TaxID=1181884 RepID=UPI0034DE3304